LTGLLVAVDPDAAPSTPAPASSPDEPRPPAVPRPSVPPEDAPASPSPAPAFVTYLPLPPATPPVDTAELEESHLPAAEAAAAPPEVAAAAAAPPHAAPAPAAPAPAPPRKPPPAPPKPKLPKPPREPLSGGLIVAIAVTVLLLVGGGVAALVLSGGDKPKPTAAATAAPTETAKPDATRPPQKRAKADLPKQVQTLDGLMKTSHQGRAAAAKGDTKAAIANRSKLARDLQRLRGQATDKQLKAGLASFAAAIRESLRQNRECGAACPAGDLQKVNRLKQDTVDALNPLLRKYAKTTYRARDI
jgi:hypothetical protein